MTILRRGKTTRLLLAYGPKNDEDKAGEVTVRWNKNEIEIEVVRIDESVTGEVKLIVH